MKILNKIFYLALIGSAVSSAWAAAPEVEQLCDASGVRSTPTTDFRVNNDGTVFHKKTGLTWMQCPFSRDGLPADPADAYQALTSDGKCNAATTYEFYSLDDNSYVGVFRDINKLRATKGGEHWRLPTIKELASLQEENCINPPLNLEVFKMTPEFLLNWSEVTIGSDTKDVALNHGFLTSTIYTNYSDKALKTEGGGGHEGKFSTPIYFSFPVSPYAKEFKTNEKAFEVDENIAIFTSTDQLGAWVRAKDWNLLLLVRDDK